MRHIRKLYGDYFDIAVAGFPQHQLLPPAELAQELAWLKEKVDAGCNLIFTQMFYDVEVFFDWVKSVRAAGINVPIVPGIAPIQTWNGFQRATSLAKTVIPKSFSDALEPYQNDDEKVRAIGIKLVADMCRRILDADIGIRGLHFYTMNLEKATRLLLEELSLVPRVETIKPLPWRQVRHSSLPSNSARLTLFVLFFAVAHAKQTRREHPSHLLGESRQVLRPPHGELGRVPQRAFRRLPQSRLW